MLRTYIVAARNAKCKATGPPNNRPIRALPYIRDGTRRARIARHLSPEILLDEGVGVARTRVTARCRRPLRARARAMLRTRSHVRSRLPGRLRANGQTLSAPTHSWRLRRLRPAERSLRGLRVPSPGSARRGPLAGAGRAAPRRSGQARSAALRAAVGA